MFSSLFLLLASTSAAYLVPNPPGKYNVTLTTGPLTDYSRNVSSDTTSAPRELMLSVFEPVTCTSTVAAPYMPNKTAEYQKTYIKEAVNVTVDLTPLFKEARLPVCSSHDDRCHPKDHSPILLFSPGYGGPRVYYNAIAAAVASEGFTVISIDHPEDANIITYPDGHVVYNKDAATWDPAVFAKRYEPRLLDTEFVIDQLSNATAMAKLLPHREFSRFKTDRIAMFGHSLGGATAVVAAARDHRIRAAINWDGTIFGSLNQSKWSQPVMFVSHANVTDSTWLQAWPRLEGPKLWLTVANTTHYSFTDIPTMGQAAGQDLSAYAGLLGTIPPSRMVRALAAYTAAWMDGAFKGKEGGPLLEGKEAAKYPEVSTRMKGNF